MEQKEKSFSEIISNLNTTSWDAYSNYRLYSDSEFKQQSKMTYEELCSVLKTKYGAVTTRQKSEEKLLTHYIYEGYYAGFDNVKVDFEHSKSDFVYCNIFEHLLLHIIDAIRFFSTPTEQLERYLRLTSLHTTQYKKGIYRLTRIDSDEWKFAIYGSEVEFIGPEIKRQFIKNKLDFNISEELFNQTMIDYLYTVKKENKVVGQYLIERYQQRVLEHCFVDCEVDFIKWLDFKCQYKSSFASTVMSYNIGDRVCVNTFGPSDRWFKYLQKSNFLTEQNNDYVLNDCPIVILYKLKNGQYTIDEPSLKLKATSIVLLTIIIAALILCLSL